MSASPTHVRQAPGVASRVVDGRAVLVIQRRETLHSLNSSGTLLWGFIGGDARPFDALCTKLAEEYGLPAGQAEADARRFVEQLVAVGALETGPGS